MDNQLVAEYACLFPQEWLGTVEQRQHFHVEQLCELLVAKFRQTIQSQGCSKLLIKLANVLKVLPEDIGCEGQQLVELVGLPLLQILSRLPAKILEHNHCERVRDSLGLHLVRRHKLYDVERCPFDIDSLILKE